ncbi:PLP-dependent transferase [Mollisia scopiformis]|uniref:PLP-dependent transferase n=1 Tax=Mollisia scopiformis TaxID=149040 RepID=A0A194XAL6_MOLSC|nr:PLP-dependent transferase [Mollisia scopiformis]KUJ17215.1 PLP-dependent transferase [Mollisia scopiformis]
MAHKANIVEISPLVSDTASFEKSKALSQISIQECSNVESTNRPKEKITLSESVLLSDHLTEGKHKHYLTRRPKFKNIAYEATIFAKQYVVVRLREIRLKTPYDTLTSIGRCNHYCISPLYNWYGQNDRILVTAPLSQVGIRERDQSIKKVINCGSHNYAGLYDISDAELALHQTCLEQLPIANTAAASFLHEMLSGLASFFNAKSCFSTSTGYQSNMLGIPAIAKEGWLIVLDEKSHNSIFTGAYSACADAMKKFKHNNMVELRRILEDASLNGNYTDVLHGTIPPLDALSELKQQYNFVLYVDEAHSFGSIGRTGRGLLELWNDEHPENTLSPDVIDVRSGVLSKAVGALGGFVCTSSSRFDECLLHRSQALQQWSDPLTTATIVQTLRFLKQPRRLERNLHRLKDISRFCHEELDRQGVHVYGDQHLNHLPMLPVFGGRPSKAAELSMVLRRNGVVASPISTPAVDIWESRVRVLLSASYTDEDVNSLITAIAAASRQIGLKKRTRIPRQKYCYNSEEMMADEDENNEMLKHLNCLIQEQVRRLPRLPAISLEIINAGMSAQHQYGIPSGTSRWMLGTFSPHLSVESLVAQLTHQRSALTYPDSGLGLMSTIAGLCRPVLKTKRHYLLFPSDLEAAGEEGLRVASKKNKDIVCIRYTDFETLRKLFVSLGASKKIYITIYIQPSKVNLHQLAERLRGHSIRGCTLLLDINNDTLSNLDTMSVARLQNLLSARILISSSFYSEFSMPGGYLAGDES